MPHGITSLLLATGLLAEAEQLLEDGIITWGGATPQQ
jgi:hypothetical protein